MVQRRTQGEFSDPFAESRRLNTMACTPQRAGGKDGHVVVSTPPQHYGTVHGTPGQGRWQLHKKFGDEACHADLHLSCTHTHGLARHGR